MKVELTHVRPDRVIEIVRELRKQGYHQGSHFDFAYSPARYNNDGWEAVSPKTTVFTFYTDELATYFTLKYL
jgi:hypothetical protein